jgi:hypothetical protein
MLVVVASAAVVAQSDAGARKALADQFAVRTGDGGGAIAAYLQNQATQLGVRAQDLLSGPTITPGQLQIVTAGLGFTAGSVFTRQGRLIVDVPLEPSLIGAQARSTDYIHQALVTGTPAVSQVRIARG